MRTEQFPAALILRCVACGAQPLQQQADRFTCPACATRYPILHEVPVFFPHITIIPRSGLPPALIESIARGYDLPDHDEHVRATLHAMFGKSYRFGDFQVDVESAQFLSRFRHSQANGSADAAVDEGESYHVTRYADTPVNVPDALRYRYVTEYLPRHAAAGTTFTSNVRIHNTGMCTIRSAHTPPAFLAYHWCDTAGRMVEFDGQRTPLLIDLLPGRQLTQPIRITTPRRPGDYQLVLSLVLEGVAWFDSFALHIPMRISKTAPSPPPGLPAWQQTHMSSADYAADHQRAIGLLRERLRARGGSQPRILEIGGNAAPMIHQLTGERFNVDVDLHGLQIAQMRARYRELGVQQLCADVSRLPFADQQFDCVAVFASLHHFPDIRGALQAMRRQLRPGGLLAVLCEPNGHVLGIGHDTPFHQELLKGVNEQSFSLEEYARLFAEAGLDARDVIVDTGSLKAFLTPLPGAPA
jgi:SAM-dependent methyltransferase